MDYFVDILSETGLPLGKEKLPTKYSLVESFGREVLGRSELEDTLDKILINSKRRPGQPEAGKPIFGTCHVCGSPMPMYLGLKKGQPWYFYHCPVCDRNFRYVSKEEVV